MFRNARQTPTPYSARNASESRSTIRKTFRRSALAQRVRRRSPAVARTRSRRPPGRRPRASSRARGRRRPARPRPTSRATIAGHVVARRALEQPHAGVRLDLDTAGLRQLGRAALGHELPARDDRHPVADELDLAEQVRVEQHRVTPRSRSSSRSARTVRRPDGSSALVGSSRSRHARRRRRAPARSRAAAACPSTSPRRGGRARRPGRRARAAPRAPPRRRRSRRAAGAARAARPPLTQPGKRKSSAR